MTDDSIRIVYRHIKKNSIIAVSRMILKHISIYSAFVQVSSMFTAIINESMNYYNKNIERKIKYWNRSDEIIRF